MERLDKVLSNLGYGTRKEIKQVVRKGLIEVNGEIVKDNGMQIDPEVDKILVNGEEIFYRKYIYLMMNKPDGVVSATFDNRDETVIDLLEIEHQVFEPFPVGRLDKDTVGLLLLTNDGELNHRLISPKWKVDKVYYAKIDKKVTEADIKKFKNGEIVKDNGMQIDPEVDKILVNGEEIFYRKYIYLMMNKPDGVVSATFDNRDETVIDLLEIEHQVFEPFPVGRLDKDTVGLLLLTNDGELNHRLISPKWKVDKVYYAKIDKKVTEADIKKFKNGITLDDGYTCKEAKLEILESSDSGSEVMITIQEGKFHQVKRMFEAVDKSVVYLKRVEFGTLQLDEDLEEGEYRELTEEEVAILKGF